MGADKNSSPKRELGLYPKFTTKDSHTSLPASRSHYRLTNPRNKHQTIPKRKHEPRSKGLSSSARHQVDSPRPWGGRSATHGRSVNHNRMTKQAHRNADGPYLIHGWSVSNGCRADGLRRPGGRSAKLQPAKNNWPNGSKRRRSRTHDEHEEP
jgi:hypothetical protein